MRRILIVDDEHVIADTLMAIFGKGGFDARVAYSTDDALLRAREFAPDLLLCDINMPGRDGLELIEELLREQPDCRVMVLTGSVVSMRRVREGYPQLCSSDADPGQAVPAGRPVAPGRRNPAERLTRFAPMPDLSRLLISLGSILLVLGVLVALAGRLHLPIGRLPGDLTWRGRNTTVFIPLASSLLLSLVLSALFWILNRLR